jgi:hypothetical protein
MSGPRLLFLNFLRADSGTIGNDALPSDYVLACRFLRCSIMDRTGTLRQGFDYAVLDQIPSVTGLDATFGELCDQRAADLVRLAKRRDQDLCVHWSGGIDSTATLIAISRAARESNAGERVVVVLSQDSVHENPRFFLQHIHGVFRLRPATHPIAYGLDPAAINVTGEHGDQLFGSHLLESYVRRGLADVDYADILPLVLFERLRSVPGAIRVKKYLQPVANAAPVPIRSLFDYLWWMNFALKWQEVTLRLPAWRRDDARDTYRSLHHFYRTEGFQAWALGHAMTARPYIWADYKHQAKRYIHSAVRDDDYLRTKEKEDSLRNVMGPANALTQVRMLMREDFRPVHEYVEV